jgi:hypothetical protein
MTRYPPLWTQDASFPSSGDRQLVSALWPSARTAGLAVSAQGNGLILNIDPGSAAVPVANGNGSVLCASDAVDQLELPPADVAGQHRFDLVIVEPRADDIGIPGPGEFVFRAVSGVSSGAPTPPATPAGTLALAQVYVAGNAQTIVAGNITDLRPGSLPVPSQADIDQLPRGRVASASGPPSAVNVGATAATLVSLPFTARAGRRYRIMPHATGSGFQAVGVNTSFALNSTPTLVGSATLAQAVGLGINIWLTGSGVWEVANNGTVDVAYALTVTGFSGGGTGTPLLAVPASACRILVEDIGPV